MKSFMRTFFAVVVVGLIGFLINYISTHNMGVLNPKGVIALAEKNLLITAVLLMLIVVIPVFVMLFTFAWTYREGNKKAKYSPDWHTNPLLEGVWWAIPAIIICILATITWKSSHDLDPQKALSSNVKPITIQVVALDWKWLFIYPEENIATVNFVEIPKNTPIEFKITADAPMNAFWIPQLGTQVYAMPGMTAELNLMASEIGDFKGVSSNFSGDGFSGMKFLTRVSSREEYDRWVEVVRASPESLTLSQYNELRKQSKDTPMRYYTSPETGLYNTIIMNFMSPTGADNMNMH